MKYLIIILSSLIFIISGAFSQSKVNEVYLFEYGGKKYLPTSDRPYGGKAFNLYESGNKHSEGSYKMGMKNGLWTYWSEDGKKIIEINHDYKSPLQIEHMDKMETVQLKRIDGLNVKLKKAQDDIIANNELILSKSDSLGSLIDDVVYNLNELSRDVDKHFISVKQNVIDIEESFDSLRRRINRRFSDIEQNLSTLQTGLKEIQSLSIVQREIEALNRELEALHSPPPPPEGPRAKFIPYDDPPVPITPIRPEYPEIAQESGVEGTVYVQAFIDKNGRVKEVTILKGIPNTGLNEAAMDAIRKTHFHPAKQRDRAVGVYVSIPVNFILIKTNHQQYPNLE